MNDPIIKSLKETLKRYLSLKNQHLCLGLSGGPDSMSLLHLLLECKNLLPFQLSVAHIDHGWRRESSEEAEQIRCMARDKNIPCYLHKLQIDKDAPNLEDLCRSGRLEFFRSLYNQGVFDILLLGHQADDRAETVLKRIFEGANVNSLPGLREFTIYREMPVLRPLLGFSKKELLQWLDAKGVAYFRDATNLDPRFLRGRMRKELFPFIEQVFGKKIQKNLNKFADRSLEMNRYLEKNIKKFYPAISWQERCLQIDFTNFPDLDKVEISFFLSKILKLVQDHLSFQQQDRLIKMICGREYNKKIISKNAVFKAHGGKLYIEFSNGEIKNKLLKLSGLILCQTS